jgi:hypothetical protein
VRARFVNEKFEEESDPIHDLGIGGIYLYDMYLKLVPKKDRKKDYNSYHPLKSHEKWLHYLKETFLGKEVKFKRDMGDKEIKTVKVFNVTILYPYQVFFFKADGYNWRVDLNYRVIILG